MASWRRSCPFSALLLRFFCPVGFVILDYAERVNPNQVQAQFDCHLNGIAQGSGQVADVDASLSILERISSRAPPMPKPLSLR